MMDGLATATIVASTRIMKKPTIIAHSARHGSATGPAPPAGLPRSAVVISPPRLGSYRWCRLLRPDASAIGPFVKTLRSLAAGRLARPNRGANPSASADWYPG